MACVICGKIDRRIERRWRKVPPYVHPRWWEQSSYIAREPATELIEVVVEEHRQICRPHWYGLPLKLRRRWWRETDYGAREPSPGLIEAIRSSQSSTRAGIIKRHSVDI
jgi:hypothetical protein